MLKTGLSLLPSSDYESTFSSPNSLPPDLVLELTLDAFPSQTDFPKWYNELIERHLHSGGTFLGHVITWPVYGRWSGDREQNYLSLLRSQVTKLGIKDVTVHYGSLASNNHLLLPPVPLPHTRQTKVSLQNQITRLKDALQCDVGVELLALALSKEDAYWQVDAIAEASERSNSFVHVDFHNLYCHCVNFGLKFEDILSRLPIERIKHAHVSGGSESLHGKNFAPFRRDTHDNLVPEELWGLLETWLGSLSNLATITFERIAGSFEKASDGNNSTQNSVFEELRRLDSLVSQTNKARNKLENHNSQLSVTNRPVPQAAKPEDADVKHSVEAEELIQLFQTGNREQLEKLYSAPRFNEAIDLRAVDAARLILEKWTI